jgi:hypothetical protein
LIAVLLAEARTRAASISLRIRLTVSPDEVINVLIAEAPRKEIGNEDRYG